MIKFEPKPDITYRFNYNQIFSDIANNKLPEKDALRSLILSDLFFIVNFIFKIPNANRKFIVDACCEVENNPFGWHFYCWARFHWKSSIITKARTLQRILQNPERTAMFVSHTRPMAKKFLRPLMLEMEMNQALKSIFPDILYKNPRSESPKWSEDDGCVVKRRSTSRSEATIEAWGIKEGMPIGVHFDDIIMDDLEVKDDVQNPDVILKIREAVDLARFLLSEGGGMDIVGTPYSHEAIYFPFIVEKKKANGKNLFTLNKKPATEDGTRHGRPVLITREELDDLAFSMGEYEFNSQMLLNPTPVGSRTLDSKYLQEIEPHDVPKRVLKFMVIDPAGDGTKKRNDAWSIIVCAVEPKLDNLGLSNVYVIDAVVSQLREVEVPEIIAKMYIRNGMIEQLGVEKAATSTTEIHVANALAQSGRFISESNGTLKILRPAGRSNAARISALVPLPLYNGKIFVNSSIETAYKERMKMEADKFPMWHDDFLSTLAWLYEMVKDYNKWHFFDYEDEEDDTILSTYSNRNKITGY